MGGGRAVAEMERPVEGTDDQAGSAGTLADPAGVGGIDRLFFGKETLGVGDGEIDFGDQGGGLGPAFGDGFANFAADPLRQLFLMGLQGFLGGAEALDPFRQRGFAPALSRGSGRGEHGFRRSGLHLRQKIGEIGRIGVAPGFGISGHGHRGRP